MEDVGLSVSLFFSSACVTTSTATPQYFVPTSPSEMCSVLGVGSGNVVLFNSWFLGASTLAESTISVSK